VLEDVYRKYRDRVNFVWVYGREAHPEELPFGTGFETRDLGWDHRYFATTTMEQRARRARWMKTDLAPDAEMPMIIDYVDSPLGPDDAIKQAYVGGGFYSGFVIDCDGTIVHQANWAWFSPGGQWWGLPLEPVAELEAFLDDYLADPPPCYQPPAGAAGSEARAGAPDPPATILLVDDDNGKKYEGYFRIPLGNLKTRYDLWEVHTAGSPPAGLLADYRVVVWFTGDQSQQTLTAADQAALAAYLDGGGKLLLSGQDIGQDLAGSAFYQDYLHATLVEDDADAVQVVGQDILTGINASLVGGDGAGNQTSPSRISLGDGAVGLFRYSTAADPAWAALRWQGHYQVVYLAFGLEGFGSIGAAAPRFKTVRNVLAWFDELPCPGDIDFDADVDLDDFALFGSSLAGPGETQVPPGVDFTHFARADLDLDGDVDLADFDRFQERFGDVCE